MQNKACWEVISELLNNKNKINPLYTKYLSINQIFFSKALAHFTPVASIDPNRL